MANVKIPAERNIILSAGIFVFIGRYKFFPAEEKIKVVCFLYLGVFPFRSRPFFLCKVFSQSWDG